MTPLDTSTQAKLLTPLQTSNIHTNKYQTDKPNQNSQTSFNNIESSKQGISPASLDWKIDNQGHCVPVSKQFNDIYYSVVDGLAESRYVFLTQNHLSKRFANLSENQVFTIAELGFGTGLNFFATWQLWQQTGLKQSLNHPHLHFISFEKFPLTKADLIKALLPWRTQDATLAILIDEFIELYPPLVEGCHRLSLPKYHITLDLWFGDAEMSLSKLNVTPCSDVNTINLAQDNDNHNTTRPTVDAWYLDGFAPSCNQSLWAEQIFQQMKRLSSVGTTVATFSCAGIVKRGLSDIGFKISKVKGFGRKREMLTAIINPPDSYLSEACLDISTTTDADKPTAKQSHTMVIGAGISGLMAAWSLANRGTSVTIVDKSAPLSGASGNPRAILAPKMTPLHHIDEHLHSIGYLYSSRLFAQMDRQSNSLSIAPKAPSTPPIFEQTGVIDLLVKANVTGEQIHAYPDEFAQVLTADIAQKKTKLSQHDFSENQFLPLGGLVNPVALASTVLAHPLIDIIQADIDAVTSIHDTDAPVRLTTKQAKHIYCQRVIICTAHHSHHLDSRIFDFRKIRGQLSWFTPNKNQLNKLPDMPLKYGGYCTKFVDKNNHLNDNQNDDHIKFLIGASFVRNDTSVNLTQAEHEQNRDKLLSSLPELTEVIDDKIDHWTGRAGIRAQTPDYHPLVGKVGQSQHIWTLSGMGSKGFAFAPLCAEILADMITGQVPPVSTQMLQKLSPNRQRLKRPLSSESNNKP